MRQRAFGQYCGLARTLEVVGERWALLIVRDLLVRPRRYTDLREGLAGIPTNVLSTRLKELEEAGVVERRLAGRSVVYALTADGRDLDEAVLLLGRWGATRLEEPRPGEIVTPESLVMALRATFRPEAAAGVTATWEIHAGDIVLHARVADEQLDAGVGPAADPDLVIVVGTDGPPPLRALMAGELTPAAAVERGSVRLTGPVALLTTFVTIFRI